MGPRSGVLSVADACGHPYWAFGGAPYGATKRCILGLADSCGHTHWGLRWSSLWGHESPCRVWRTHVATPLGP
eukprot:1599010-Pyramimonas_sp.AAC.1